MIIEDEDRATYYYRKEQQARLELRERNEYLYEKARRQVDLRIWSYPKHMRRHYASIVEQMYRDMCDEDLTRKKIIDNQQHFLRLAQGYKVRTLA